MTKYDNTDEKDESKWILRATGKVVTVDTVVKVIFSNRKVISFTNWKRNIIGISTWNMNTFDKFNEEQLPSEQQFYSRLSEEDITNDDCKKAKQIRKHFNIKNMGVYRDSYLQTDVLFLMDVWENFEGHVFQLLWIRPCLRLYLT